MEDLLKVADEFLDSGNDNIIKKRYNAAVSDFFKAIAVYCDCLIYNQLKLLPKNHNERFHFLNTYFKEIYDKVYILFKKYKESYNLILTEKDAIKIKDYAYELRNFVKDKK